MKALPLSLQDKAFLNARNTVETIIGHIKDFSPFNLSKHRSVINPFVHIVSAITACQITPFKPKLNLQPRYRLQTTILRFDAHRSTRYHVNCKLWLGVFVCLKLLSFRPKRPCT
jgi:hypothetical protein